VATFTFYRFERDGSTVVTVVPPTMTDVMAEVFTVEGPKGTRVTYNPEKKDLDFHFSGNGRPIAATRLLQLLSVCGTNHGMRLVFSQKRCLLGQEISFGQSVLS
jgi:hypothetical protein